MIVVCVAAYNGERFISQQINSILASPLVTRVIVSDDGSFDGTVAVLKSIDDRRLTLLRGPGQGLIRNFEFLLQQVTEDYVFLSDQDDVWDSKKVQIALERLQSVDLVVSDCLVVDENLSTIHPSFFGLRNSGPGIVKNISRNTYLGCCMAFRSEVLKYVMPFPVNLPMHDWWIGLSVEMLGRVAFIDEKLVFYRRHGKNVSSTAEPSNHPWRIRVKWRLWLVYYLVILKTRILLKL